jgi:hypothetical protein|tara:strand:+ start:97 stop:378 length:282 start_codon:yes stop_codon:yes gene_type:complete
MTEHAVMVKQTDLSYVYDSDDDKIRQRRIRNRKEKQKKERRVVRKRKRCDSCGMVITGSSYITFDVTTDDTSDDIIYVCLPCVVDGESDGDSV